MLTEDRPLPGIPPELPAKPLHAGNKGYKRPEEYAWPLNDYPTNGVSPPPKYVEAIPFRAEVLTDSGVSYSGYDPVTSPEIPGVWPIYAPANTILDCSNTPADDVLPNDSKARKAVPAAAVLDYFDSAIVEIAKALQDGNKQHNPGEPLHWARGKSADHDHCIIRHFLQRGKLAVTPTGAVIRHSTYLAIRALMLLQQELEDNGAPLSRGSRLPK